MEIKFTKSKWHMESDGEIWLSLRVDKDSQNAAKGFVAKMSEAVKEALYVATFKRHRKKRSNDANAYMWVLCDKIAAVVGITKEEVYQQCVRDVGVYTRACVYEDEADEFMQWWSNTSLGASAERKYESREHEGYVWIFCYHGSSKYDTAQMSRLIDSIQQEAEQLGIDTKTPNEIEEMLSLWESAA